MKGFILTLILFTLLIASIIINCFFVNNVHKDMHELVDKVSPYPSEENEALIKQIEKLWDERKKLLSISVSFSEIDKVTNSIDALSASNQSKDATQIAINIKLLQNAIDTLKRLEMFSVENIL